MNDEIHKALDFIGEFQRRFQGEKIILAGGAVRDTILNKPINDYDVYTNLKLDKLVVKNITRSVLTDLGCTNITNHSGDKYVKFNMIKFETPFNKTMELICSTERIHHVIENFDVGLCQAYVEDEKLVLTDKFKRDRDNKTLTLYPNCITGSQLIRSVNYHIPKLMNKFPDYELRMSYE